MAARRSSERTSGEDAPGVILSAAAQEFAERGYDGARVDAIARRAGVNKALLYYHIGNKRALYEAVLTGTLSLLAPRIRMAVEAAPTAEAALAAYACAFERAAEQFPQLPQIMLRELTSGGQHLTPVVLKAFLEVFSLLQAALKEGERSGRFRPADPLTVHLLLIAGTMLLRATRPLRARPTLKKILPRGTPSAALVSELLLQGLCVPEKR